MLIDIICIRLSLYKPLAQGFTKALKDQWPDPRHSNVICLCGLALAKRFGRERMAKLA